MVRSRPPLDIVPLRTQPPAAPDPFRAVAQLAKLAGPAAAASAAEPKPKRKCVPLFPTAPACMFSGLLSSDPALCFISLLQQLVSNQPARWSLAHRFPYQVCFMCLPHIAAGAKKARILKNGQLTLTTWGADESFIWLKRIGEFQCAVRCGCLCPAGCCAPWTLS